MDIMPRLTIKYGQKAKTDYQECDQSAKINKQGFGQETSDNNQGFS